MNFESSLGKNICYATFALFAAQAHAADLTILTAGAFRQVVLAVVPSYEHDTGNHVVIKNDTAGALVKRIKSGEPFDLLIVPKPVMEQLAKSHLVVDDGKPLASVGIGVAVREGASKPDISTVAAFKATLLKAKKIAYIDPGSGGSSGMYVANLLQRLGLADALKNRIVLVQGGLVGEKVADGSADIAIHQISELLPVKGVSIVGPLPEEIQSYTTYSGAVGTSAKEVGPANAFLSSLTGPVGHEILAQKGMISAR